MFGFSFKKKEIKSTTKIVSAGLEETLNKGLKSGSSQQSTCDGSVSEEKSSSSVVITQLQTSHVRLADQACDRVRELCLGSKGWKTWEMKSGVKLESFDSPEGRTIGRGTVEWMTDLYSMNEVEDFLWNSESKTQYDEFSEAMLLMIQYENDYHVVDQVFKSRFGISGRDFMVVVHKCREDTESQEILVIGVQSIPQEHEAQMETLMEQEVAERYWSLTKKTVRGIAFAAGYYVERTKSCGTFRLTYVNDADVKSRGVPQWIVTQVKLDQLKIVGNIPRCIDLSVTEEHKDKEKMEVSAPSCIRVEGNNTDVVDAHDRSGGTEA